KDVNCAPNVISNKPENKGKLRSLGKENNSRIYENTVCTRGEICIRNNNSVNTENKMINPPIITNVRIEVKTASPRISPNSRLSLILDRCISLSAWRIDGCGFFLTFFSFSDLP